MADLTRLQHRAPGECLVLVDDREIDDLYPFLLEVAVDTSREANAEAVLKLETRRDVDGSWIVQDDDRIRPWKRLRIEAAFGEDTEEVMRGYIREVQVEFPQEPGGALVTVTVQDDSLLLDRAHKRRTWGSEEAPATDGRIVGQIVSDAGLSLTDPSVNGQSGLAVNQDGTDAAFLKKRAEANGFELIYRAGEVYFGPWRTEAEAQATIMVYAGPATNCIQFDVKDDGHKPDAVTVDVAAEDGDGTVSRTLTPDIPPMGQEPATSVETLDDGFVWRIAKQGESEPGKAEQMAQQKANENAFKVLGAGTLDGTRYGHVLLPGLPVGVDGVGTRHAGTWYVDSVRHLFDVEGYRQEFELLRNAYGDNLAAGDNPLAAAV